MAKRNTQDERVLDAAHATVLDFGVRRATLTEVARRAGISRMTVYRRFADAPELMRALMSREFGEVLMRAADAARDEPDPLDRVVAAVTGTVAMLLEHPLLLRLLELEPEVLMPYLAQRTGAFQDAAREALAAWIAEAQRAGRARDGDPAELAAVIELLGRGPVIAARAMSDAERRQISDVIARGVRGVIASDLEHT